MIRRPRACPHRTPPRPTPHTLRVCLGLLCSVMTLASLPGCQLTVGGERGVAEENERLRRRNLQLERETEALSRRLAALETEAKNLRRRLTGEDRVEHPALEGVEPPRLSRLGFSRLSGPVDLDGDERDDVIRIYVQPQDQQGRVMPVAGRATVRATRLPADGEPEVVARRVYEPDELDDVWRHSFTGIHYTLELPLPDTLPPGETRLMVDVSLLSASTGAVYDEQETMTVQR